MKNEIFVEICLEQLTLSFQRFTNIPKKIFPSEI